MAANTDTESIPTMTMRRAKESTENTDTESIPTMRRARVNTIVYRLTSTFYLLAL